MNTFELTQVFLVSFDICQFSRSLDYPKQLAAERRRLIETIRATDTIERALRENRVAAQFVGDEMRLAFPANTITKREISQFTSSVFASLDRDAEETRWGPTVRAALVHGALTVKKHPGLATTYFEGEAVEAINQILTATREGWFATDTPDNSVQLSKRSVAEQAGPLEPSQAQTSREFVLALGVPTNSTTPVSILLDILSNSVDTLASRAGLRFSVGVRGVLTAIADSSTTRLDEILQNISSSAALHPTPPAIAAAIAHGELWSVQSQWYEQNFEGPAAIIASRIIAQANPGELLWQANLEPHMHSRRAFARYKTVSGKRGETFSVGSQVAAFPLPPGGSTHPASLLGQACSAQPTVKTGTVLRDTYISEFLTELQIQDDIRVPVAEELAALTGPSQFAACAVLSALYLSGLIPKPALSTLSTLQPAGTTSASLFVLPWAAHTVLTREFAIWKQFHSTAGDLARYCQVVLAASESWDSKDLSSLRSSIRNDLSAFTGNAGISFDEALAAIASEGCKPLATSYHVVLHPFTNGEDAALAYLADMDCADIVSWGKNLLVVFSSFDRMRAKVINSLEILSKQIPGVSSQFVLKQLSDLLTYRRQASWVSFEFAAALLAADYLLGLNTVSWKPDDIKLAELVVRRTVAEMRTLLRSHPERVVVSTNNVLFAWIGLFRHL